MLPARSMRWRRYSQNEMHLERVRTFLTNNFPNQRKLHVGPVGKTECCKPGSLKVARFAALTVKSQVSQAPVLLSIDHDFRITRTAPVLILQNNPVQPVRLHV